MVKRIIIKNIIGFIALTLFIYCINIQTSYAQDEVKEEKENQILLDEIVAVVGNQIVLKSDVEDQLAQYRMDVGIAEADQVVKTRILEELMFKRLLMHYGEVDSVEVSDQQVEYSVDHRINYFISQAGSVRTFEQYYGKPLDEIKEDMREIVRQDLLSQGKRQEIIQNVKITPTEVKTFFKKIPRDSIPVIPSKYEFGQITKKPEISERVKKTAMDRITGYRNRILKGESFEILARAHSDDPGSAKQGGELGLTKRGNWDPAFTTAAFKLKPGEISEVVESQFGYHILKFIDRKGDKINVRHILVLLKPSDQDAEKAIRELDSIANLIRIDSLTFEEALKHSDDLGRFTGGLMINRNTNNSFFTKEELDRPIAYELGRMEVGDISNPVAYKDEKQDDAYRILYLKTKTLPHKANLKEDYDIISNWALQDKQLQVQKEWIDEKIKVTYIRLNKEFHSYKFQNKWVD